MPEQDRENGNHNSEYDETVLNYDKAVDWHEEKSNLYDWSALLNRFVDGLPGNRVLDAGCGTGRDIPSFTQKNINIEGLDNSAQSIERLHEKYPEIPAHVADLRETLPLKDGMYDGIWACASLLNLRKSDIVGTLQEFHRLLVKDGRLFVSVKAGEGEKMVDDQAGRRLFSFYTTEELRDTIAAVGFEIVELQSVSDAELTGSPENKSKPDWVCVLAKK